jgi:hypothetical protein
MLPGFDGPITSMAKVNILFLMGHLANVVMDFIAQNLSTSGLVVSAFFVVILALIAINLVIIFINLDLHVNRPHLQNFAFAGYFIGLTHFFLNCSVTNFLGGGGFMP